MDLILLLMLLPQPLTIEYILQIDLYICTQYTHMVCECDVVSMINRILCHSGRVQADKKYMKKMNNNNNNNNNEHKTHK